MSLEYVYELTTSFEVSCIKIRCNLWSVCKLMKRKEEEYRKVVKKQMRIWKVCISPTGEAAPVQPISTKFSNSSHLIDVVIPLKFGVEWSSSFGCGEVRLYYVETRWPLSKTHTKISKTTTGHILWTPSLASPVGTTSGTYYIAALPSS